MLSLVISLVAAPAANAAPGGLDPSFGSGGMVRLLEGKEGDGYADAVAVQPDGKIVVAGYEKNNAFVLRLLPNGELDPAFGAGGKTTTVIPTGFSGFRAVTLQPDGRIVAVGEAKGAVTGDFLIARFNSDGSPDGSFGGGDGVELVPVGALSDQADAVAIGPEGKIAATGLADLTGSNEALAVVVLKANGEPDPSFGGDGSVTKETAENYDKGVAIAMFGDGGILVADNNAAGGGAGFVLMKLLADGEYDPGFGGGDGIVFTELPVEGAEGISAGRINDFAVQPDGRIVAAGYGLDYVGTPPTYRTKVAAIRYTPEGDLDPSFASGGIFTHRVENEGQAETMELGEKGRVLLAGYYEDPVSKMNSAWVGRLDANGALDPSFGAGGLVLRSDTAPFGEGVEGSAIDPEDRLVTIGTGYGGNNTSWTSLTRYLGDPRPPVAVPISSPAPAAANQPAHAKMKRVPKKVSAGRLKSFSGTAGDPDGNGVQKVQIALVKVARGDARASREPARHCSVLKNAKPRFKRVRARPYAPCPQRWLTAKGAAKWSFKFKGPLPPGKYVVYARAIDGKGLAETSFSRTLGNRYAFRVVASR
jgi:uncharacterized delta-60 repeat protein